MDLINGLALGKIVPYALEVIGAIVVLIITIIVAGWVQRGVRRSLERSHLDPTVTIFASNLARYTVLVLGGLAVLGVFGIPIASFAAILAAAAFAVGLALQGTLQHFAAGVMLLIMRPFRVGDAVAVAGVSGTVVEIGIFSTLIDTWDNRRLVVPNGSIYGSTIENTNFHDIRRADVAVGTDYGADLNATRAVLEGVAASIDGALSEPAPGVALTDLGASSVNWVVRVWAPVSDFGAVRERLTHGIKEALDDAGIGIPYPQMDVHVDAAAEQRPTAAAGGSGSM